MPVRPLLAALSCALAFTALAWAQGDSTDLETLWRTGRFDSARAIIDTRWRGGDRGQEFLAQAARAAEEMRDYALAQQLWQEYARTPVATTNDYRLGKEHAWRCAWKANGESAKAQWVTVAEAEVGEALRKAGNKAGPARQLALELEFTLQRILNPLAKPGEELRQNYPKSEVVLQAAKRALDTISWLEKDSQRLAGVKQFLADYPGNYWRHAAYRLWLYTSWQAGDLTSLRAGAAKYLAEYPQHPDSRGAVSRYFLEADVDTKAGLEHAKASTELYAKQLGTDGSAASLARLNEATRALAPQPDWLPASKRQQFTDYLGSRYNLARYLIAAGNHAGALKEVQPILDCDPFTLSEELTLALFAVIAGQAAQASADNPAAYRHYLTALMLGDTRNRAVVMAQSGFNTVAPKLSTSEQSSIAVSLVPKALYGVPLPVFADLSEKAGLAGQRARRVAWADVDGDGAVDLLLDGSVLLRQEAGGKFTDASKAWGLTRGKLGGIFADIENDGDLDIYTFGGGERGDRLLRNDGGHFADVTAVYGDPTDSARCEAAAFADFDNDGWIDLFVANSPAKLVRGASGSTAGAANMLYRNTGGGKYTRLAATDSGMVPPFGMLQAGRSAGCIDLEGDGDQDLFIGNAVGQENLLWRNEGRFTNVARLAGVAGWKTETGWGDTNGCDWGDANNDGRWDLFACNYVEQQQEYDSNPSQLLIAQATGEAFTDVTSSAGIRFAPTLQDALWFDCNNDGWLDLYLTAAGEARRSYLYLNDGQGGLHDMTYLARARLFNTWGSAWADYDSDGDLDLLIASPDGVRLLRNDSPAQNWLQIQCSGSATAGVGGSNRSAIGTHVRVVAEGLDMQREIHSGKGIGCGNQLLAHFGLGQAKGRVSIVVRFPSGRTATRAIVAANQTMVFVEDGQQMEQAAPVAPPVAAPAAPQADATPEDEVTRPPGGRSR